MDNLIKLATFNYPYEMDIARTMLESEGISCFLRDDNMSYAINSIVEGGIKLYVADEDFERASELISRHAIELDDDSEIEIDDTQE